MDSIKVWPWHPGDNGRICMPMEKNVPTPKNSGWQLVQCPVCGGGCWEDDLTRQLVAQGLEAACTECALKGGNKCQENR